MGNWFPVHAELLECSEFQSLSKSEKLFYVLLVSEYNRARVEHPALIRPDIWFAAALSLSVVKVRQARRKLARLGLIEYKPGQITRRGGVATKYLAVKYATVQSDAGRFFAQVQRFSFEALLHIYRGHWLNLDDVLVWVVLCFTYWRCRGKQEDKRFYISKRELRRLSGASNPAGSIVRLYHAHTFKGGTHLFEYTDRYHKLTFRDWLLWAEPDGKGGNDKLAKDIQAGLQQRIAELSKPTKPGGKRRKASKLRLVRK